MSIKFFYVLYFAPKQNKDTIFASPISCGALIGAEVTHSLNGHVIFFKEI
jgi:hypothetical protein